MYQIMCLGKAKFAYKATSAYTQNLFWNLITGVVLVTYVVVI